MIPLPTPPHRHAVVDEQEAVRQLSLLDPCSAWRADLADAGLTEPMDESLADQWLLWLEIATVFDRLRSLPVSARAGYARSTSGLWQRAEQVTGAERFARVGAVMAEWEGAAPALEGYRELLWAVEQGEAEGAVRLTYNALYSLSSVVPDADTRQGYAGAHAGRVLRTLGLLEQALRAFEEADLRAQHAGDEWLSVRVKLGLGVICQARGNHPAAREIFGAALERARPFVDLSIGAHLGLVSVARANEEYGVALEHGWLALQSARGDKRAEVEALTILAALSIDVGEFRAALASCRLAAAKGTNRQIHWELLRYSVQASLGLGDEEGVRANLPSLIAAVESTPDPWQEAQGRQVIGEVFATFGQPDLAIRYLEQSKAIALRGRYTKLLFLAEEALARHSASRRTSRAVRHASAASYQTIALSDESQSVIEKLAYMAAG